MKIVFPIIRHQLLLLMMLLSTAARSNDLNKMYSAGATESMSTSSSSISPQQNPLKQEQIVSWLETQRNEKIPGRNETIEKLIKSAVFDKIFSEQLEKEETLVVIPLDENFSSKNNSEQLKLNYLILICNKETVIRRGNIVQYIQGNRNVFSEKPHSNIAAIIQGKVPEEDGTYAFITLSDFNQYEFTYKEHNLVSGKSIQFSGEGQDCIHLWWVHYIVYADGHIEVGEVIDLGCSNCPSNQLCDELETIGGGGAGITECNFDKDQATAILNGISVAGNTAIHSQPAGQTVIDPVSQMEREPKTEVWDFVKYRLFLNYYAAYSAIFNGIRYRESRNHEWKYESLHYDGVRERDGHDMPPCFTSKITVNCSPVVISQDRLTARATLSYSFSVTITCAFGMQTGVKTNPGTTATFVAARNN